MADAFHDRLLSIVKQLPGAEEDWPWGSIHCKVAGKIFVGWSRNDDGDMVLGIRTDKELQAMLVASDPRFSIAKYVGKYGGVDMNIGKKPDWAEVEHFITESYRIIAPRKLVQELDGVGVKAGVVKGKTKGAKKAPATAMSKSVEASAATTKAAKR